MKTLIIYGTKHGTAEKCSKLLKDRLEGEVKIINIKKDSLPDLSAFDNIVIGGSIYAGQIQKEVKDFCAKNLEILKNKRVALFICGMNDKEAETQLNNSYPAELINSSVVKECLGAEIILKNINFFERFVVKAVAKIDKDTSAISEEKIKRVAQIINER